MLRIIGSNEDNTKTGYFGDTRFLNNQTNFNSVFFGLRPVLLAPNPMKDPNTTIQSDLQRFFLSHCKFEIFMNLCHQDYVRSDNVDVDSALCIQDIGQQLVSIKQLCRTKQGQVKDSPDEIFNQYLPLAASLPDHVEEWPEEWPKEWPLQHQSYNHLNVDTLVTSVSINGSSPTTQKSSPNTFNSMTSDPLNQSNLSVQSKI